VRIVAAQALRADALAATFEAQFSNVTNSCAGKGVMRYSW
jgi:hypothetical protein